MSDAPTKPLPSKSYGQGRISSLRFVHIEPRIRRRWQYSQEKTGHLSMAGDSFTCLSLCLPALTLSATAAAAAAIGSGLGLVDLDLARAELFSVQRADGLTASIIVSDFDEPKSARPTGFTISDEIHFAHFAELAKQFANLILS